MTVQQKAWRQLETDLDLSKKILVLGEIHGASVNVAIIDEFVRKLGIGLIMVEIERKHRRALHSAIQGERESIMNLKQDWISRSGVIGQEHIQLYAKFIREGGQVEPVKIEHIEWNMAEQKTAEKIKQLINKKDDRGVMLVVGNLHARNKPFNMKMHGDTQQYVPLGALLRNISVTVKIRYGRGEIYNFGVKSVKDYHVLQTGQKGLAHSRSPYFDYDYMVSGTSPLELM